MKAGDYALRAATGLLGIPAFAKATFTIGGKLIRYPFVLGANVLERLGLRAALGEAGKEASYVVPVVAERVGEKVAAKLPFYAGELQGEIALAEEIFGHTIERHSMNKTGDILERAATKREMIGQWLDDQRAAQIIKDVLVDFKAGKLVLDAKQGINVAIPKGLGRAAKPDGTFVECLTGRVVPRSDKLYPHGEAVITAYPIER